MGIIVSWGVAIHNPCVLEHVLSLSSFFLSLKKKNYVGFKVSCGGSYFFFPKKKNDLLVSYDG